MPQAVGGHHEDALHGIESDSREPEGNVSGLVDIQRVITAPSRDRIVRDGAAQAVPNHPGGSEKTRLHHQRKRIINLSLTTR